MKVDGALQSLIQGVSQQPPRERLPGQCALQENWSSNPVDGLIRRPPTEFIARLIDNAPAGILRWEPFVAIDGETYWAGVGAGVLRIWDLDGQEKTVTATDPLAYLTGGPIAFESIDDRTYVCDRSVVTDMLDTMPVYSMGGGLIWLLGGQYGRVFRVTLNFIDAALVPQTVSVTFSTPNGGAAADSLQVATEYIATQLHTALTGNATFNASFGATRVSDVIYIRWTDPNRIDDFDLTVDDGDGGANIFCMTRNTPAAERLPRYAPHRYVVKVTGSGSSAADDWYVQFLVADDLAAATLGLGLGKDGIWRECTAPNEPPHWDKTTMPHVLVQDPTTKNFTWVQGDWASRQAGDDESNPPPSFFGRTINDLMTFQGRLAMCSGPNVIMSRTNKHTNVFNRSATVGAEDDPIDIQSTAKSYSDLQYLIPQNRDLIAFSNNAQFIVFGRTSLNPRNASLVLTTSFEANLNAAPAPTGRNVFFAIDYGSFTGVKEFYAEGIDDVNDSRPITQHISKYILGQVRQLSSTTNFDNLIVLAEGNRKDAYLYEYLWVDDQKAQSAWSTMKFSDDVLACTFDENRLYMLLQRNACVYLVQMNLGLIEDAGINYPVMLDSKTRVDAVTTTVTVPWDVAGRDVVIVQGGGCPFPGLRVQAVSWAGNVATLELDMGGGSVYVGERYLSRFQPTMPIIKDRNGVKVGTGALNLRRLLVSLRRTGYLLARVLSKYRANRDTAFEGGVFGDPDTILGQPHVMEEYAMKVPVRDDASLCEVEFRTDSHLPASILDIEWQGQYRKRGKRMLSGEA